MSPRMSQAQPKLDDLRIERAAKPASSNPLLMWIAAGVAVVILLAGAWWFARPKAIEVRTATAREVGGALLARQIGHCIFA